MTVFSKRLNEALKIRNMTAAELARRLGINEGTVSQYKSGLYEPKQRRLQEISEILKVSIPWLLGTPPFDMWDLIDANRKGFFSYVTIPVDVLRIIWGVDKNNPDNTDIGCIVGFISQAVKSLNVDDDGNWNIEYTENFQSLTLPDDNSIHEIPKAENIIPMPKMKKVPLLGTIACGEPILAEENIEEYINMPENVNGTFALRCKGDSMINARIFNGDIVYIRQQPTVENGEIAAVLIDGEATLKKVYSYPTRLELRAENPTFTPLEYEGEEMNNIRILGKAVYFFSEVN